MSRAAVWSGVLSLLVFLSACDDPTGPGEPKLITELPRALTLAEKAVISQSNSFGFGLLKEVDGIREPGKSNTILSPLSASMALGMAMEGADGETYQEMQTVLGFEGLSREETNASYQGLMDLLLTLDPAVEMGIGNSAWSREGFPFSNGYFDALTQYFDAEVQELDFDDPGAKDIINAWVRDRTGGRIEEIIQGIGPLDILFLINAVYFKGDWTTQFKKSATQQGTFHRDDGSTVQVPMMSGTIPEVGFGWLDGNRQAAELPYGGQAFGMVMILPSPGETVDDLLEDLNDETWNAWMDALQTQEILVRIPRFEVEWDGLLKEPLKALGMVQAFDPALSDFSRMTGRPDTHISAVRQKTFMRVDEEGTEAAAATSVTIGVVSAPPNITVDRPYLLAIRERLSGSILFLGVMRDPAS